MNFFDFVIRRSTVVFHVGVSANTLKAARRKIGPIIRADYPGFHIYRVHQHIY